MKKSLRITLLAFMLALTAIFCFVPFTIGPVTLGIMILPTLIVAQIEDFKTTALLSLAMGVLNLIAWYTTKAALITAPIFRNPIVCIVPRFMIGVVAYGVSHGLRRLLKPKYAQGADPAADKPINEKALAAGKYGISLVSALMGVVTNTLLVGVFTVLFFNGKQFGELVIDLKYILAVFGINFAIEATAFSLITPPIVAAIEKVKRV